MLPRFLTSWVVMLVPMLVKTTPANPCSPSACAASPTSSDDSPPPNASETFSPPAASPVLASINVLPSAPTAVTSCPQLPDCCSSVPKPLPIRPTTVEAAIRPSSELPPRKEPMEEPNDWPRSAALNVRVVPSGSVSLI